MMQTSNITCSPSVPKNIVIGGLVGAILSIGIIFIRFMLDNRLHTKEDVEKIFRNSKSWRYSLF